jgi:hypothetical protein
VSWELDLAARLLGDAAVAALVGGRVEWDDLAPDSAFPAITLQTITDNRPQNHDGFDPFWGTRVQVNSLARKKIEAAAVREAAIAALVPYAEQGGTIFLRSFIDSGGSDAEQTQTGRICRERTDLIIWHN